MKGRYRKDPRVELAPLEQEAILFDPQESKFLVLNATGSFVWERLSDASDAQDLARAVCNHFQGVDFPEALNDVERILGEMAQHGLIVAEVTQSTTDQEKVS